MITPARSVGQEWPELPFSAWSETAATLHMFMQVVGKIRLVRTPWTNHSWHVPFYVTARGLGTSLIPYDGRAFSIEFDLLDHQLVILVTDGGRQTVALEPRTVADFYRIVIATLATLGIEIRIHTMPCEVPDAIRFEHDTANHHYDPEFATRFWRALVQIDRVFKAFRARFIGKCSPVHFFWGSFDLAVTRFSGRTAPPHPGGMPHVADWVAREAYSHEVSSAGFWPGGGGIDYPCFYSYAYPAPRDFPTVPIQPAGAFYSKELGEFLLPYEAVRTAKSPDDDLMAFLQSTYEAAADTAFWDRPALERRFGPDGGSSDDSA